MPGTTGEIDGHMGCGDEESLEEDQAGEGAESLIFESQLREGARCALNGLSAKLHCGGLLGFHGFGWYLPFYPMKVAVFAVLEEFSRETLEEEAVR